MKGIIHGRRHWKKYDGSTYYFYSMATHKRESISKEELWELGKTLPLKVKASLRKIELFKVPMTPQEQFDALTLCSISIYCLNGAPKMDMPGISMEDYSNDFYIEMVKYLKNWDPEKGPWGCLVKYVRLHTIRASLKRWNSPKNETRAREKVLKSGLNEDRYYDDLESLGDLGTRISEGRQVVTDESRRVLCQVRY